VVDLPSTVPEIESEIAQKLDAAMFNVDSSSQTAHIPRDVVAEDDRAHGRFPGTTLAHEQNFLLLMFLGGLHLVHFSNLAAQGVAKELFIVNVIFGRRTPSNDVSSRITSVRWLGMMFMSACYVESKIENLRCRRIQYLEGRSGFEGTE